MAFISHTLNIRGEKMEIKRPLVMGILNVTPDSFYAECRMQEDAMISRRIEQIFEEGGDIIDIGAYSTRPGADDVTPQEEYARLKKALYIVRCVKPDAFVSIDTFRSEVALRCAEEYGVSMINDVSGGNLDEHMGDVMAQIKIPYVLMHMRGTPSTMQSLTHYGDVVIDVISDLKDKIENLKIKGVEDVVVDPGFGFAKNLDDNFRLLKEMEDFHSLEKPILVGVSRKSMIYKTLGITPEESLNGTTALNAIALAKGCHILRVHDVRSAVEAVQLVSKLI